ncbi:hypothetical protein BN7_1980 [Wickerhamomyces ciferrii]|uniref:Wings apart-like protein C-terminal domain-containing protein n=1 Tax=Wickerhamomyces ciferrii (strain ATCC 14091 / BCRC 22168 / CBS 111 / JCM 3599 / NBRC 0793 / NRRL Y-1031 F-60-10) TaxID=1206466 RepID=K0KBL6_WICCF|nr:uncharacterized protein BN7_1980 [Wickerhamomyces ciferrii]CCH42435.1 hypothetical protein BN7_1980 [Wickerhamomyces ciferrii]
MSLRNVYGRSSRRHGSARLQSAVEFSPTKKNNLGSQTGSPSPSDSLESENIPLTSPLGSPKVLKSNGKLAKEDEDFDYGVFDLQEDDYSVPPPKKINKARTKPIKSLKKHGGIERNSRPNSQREETPGSQLSNFFVESSVKPSWSPSRSVTSSPVAKDKSSKRGNSMVKTELTYIKRELKSPKKPVKVAAPVPTGETNANDTWDFLSELGEDEGPKKKTMKLDLEGREQSESLESKSSEYSLPENNNRILESLSFEQQETQRDTQEDNEQILPALDTQNSTSSSQSTNSMKLHKSIRGYGLQRSFLLDSQNGHKDDDLDEEQDITITSEFDPDKSQGLHSVNNLRAQGENAQYIDELNFIMEGIDSKTSTSSLIELAIRLFDNSFAQFVKNHGLNNLHDFIDLDNQLQLLIFGFIVCKITEDGNGKVQFDSKLVKVVNKLLENPSNIDLRRETRITRSAFEDLKTRWTNDYSSRFFALTLLIQNNLFINDELLPNIINTFQDLSNDSSKNYKMINMTLILLERYLSLQDEVDEIFSDLIDNLFYLNDHNNHCKVPSLKLLIVLSAKNFQPVFKKDLVNKSISSCAENHNTPVGLLELGLLINLAEEEVCALKLIDRWNIKKLYKLYNQVEDEHKHYYSLLVGILITKFPIQMKKVFDEDEIIDLKHQLEAFLDKGNKLINLQVQEILSKLNEI